MPSPETISLVPWPNPRRRQNPYQTLLYGALASHGIRIRRPPPSFAMLPALPAADWLHLNWLERIYQDADLRIQEQKLNRMIQTLQRLRRKGTRILHTVHNLFPHDASDVEFYKAANRRLFELCDLFHVHAQEAADLLIRDYQLDAGRLVVMPHGHYGEYYGQRLDRAIARDRLGIPKDCRILLNFGNVKRYKGLEDVIEALRQCGDDDLRVLVAGKPAGEEMRRYLENAQRQDSRLILRLGEVKNREVAVLFSAADAFIFPGRTFFTSGSVMLALTFGLPVIAPPRFHLRDFSDRTFFKSWQPDAPHEHMSLLEDLPRWLANVDERDFEWFRETYRWENLTAGLARRLSQTRV